MSIKLKSKISDVISSVTIRGDDDGSLDTKESYLSTPFDNPRLNSKLSIRKNTSSSIEPKITMLSGSELRSLRFLHRCADKKTRITSPIEIDVISKEINHPVSTLKKSLSRLEKKGFISRNSFKCGRGGWTVYEIEKEVMKQFGEGEDEDI